VQQVQAHTKIDARSQYSSLCDFEPVNPPLLDRPFISSPRAVLPKIDSGTKPVVRIRAWLELQLFLQHLGGNRCITTVIANNDSLVSQFSHKMQGNGFHKALSIHFARKDHNAEAPMILIPI